MSRILKRPMFRRGGKVNEGIMSGLVDRTKHAENPFVGNIDRERLKANTQAITELLEEFAPVAKTRLPIGQFGLNLASGMTVTDALRDPYAQFTKADDIIVEAQVHLVFVNTDGKPVKIPDEIYSKFKPYFCDSIKI